MWTPTTRLQHSRAVTRYQTDLTDAEWRVIAPHFAEALRNGPAAGLADARDRHRHLLCRAGWLRAPSSADTSCCSYILTHGCKIIWRKRPAWAAKKPKLSWTVALDFISSTNEALTMCIKRGAAII